MEILIPEVVIAWYLTKVRMFYVIYHMYKLKFVNFPEFRSILLFSGHAVYSNNFGRRSQFFLYFGVLKWRSGSN